jgi:hypothetical protein
MGFVNIVFCGGVLCDGKGSDIGVQLKGQKDVIGILDGGGSEEFELTWDKPCVLSLQSVNICDF